MALRLISLRDGRNREIHLLSSVLDETELSDGEALALYRRRWGIELIYRSLKQTMGRRKMRCESPENAAVELDWAVVGLWLLGLMSLQRILETKVSARQWSVALSLRAVRRAMCNASACGRCRASLEQALSKATKDCYHRTSSKKARHWPHKKSEKPPGAPRARMATALEVQTAAGLKRMKPAA